MLSTSSNLDHRKWRAVCVCVGGGVVLFCPMVRFSDLLMKSSTSYRNVNLE